MKRDQLGNEEYWDEWVLFGQEAIAEGWKRLASPSGNPSYRPQYVYDIGLKHLKLIIRRYSRGDAVSDLAHHFPGLLESWEEAERLGEKVWSEQEQCLRHDWALNLHHYINCFWLTGLALMLEIPDSQWRRLLALINNEGKDELLDRVIATRRAGRPIGSDLCFPKAYQQLLEVVEAAEDKQPSMLRAYVDGWYAGLKNAGARSADPYLRTPYWYTYGDHNFKGGAYFGRWCIEAAVVAKVFDIDDTLCLDHPHYPGDLVKDGRSPRYPDASPDDLQEKPAPGTPLSASPQTTPLPKWLSSIFGKR